MAPDSYSAKQCPEDLASYYWQRQYTCDETGLRIKCHPWEHILPASSAPVFAGIVPSDRK